MADYPDYVRQMLLQARDVGQWYCGQSDGAALCYDVLALFPDCRDANDLVYELFSDEWCIYDNRVAVQRHIDEWDDRPHQQRRRLALSFRFMSRWEGWDREFDRGRKAEREGPPDVRKLLMLGKMQLLEAYCLGDEEASDYAWVPFTRAIEKSRDSETTLLWIAKEYADLGFFADAVDVLMQLCSQFKNQDARRLMAEVRWWRDNAYRVPWIPPAGDGARYKRMMQHIDPTAPTQAEIVAETRARIKEVGNAPTWKPVIDRDIAALFAEAIPDQNDVPPASVVDWSFLDADDGQPGEPADWVKKTAKLFPRRATEILAMHRWTRQITPPSAPPRRDPNDVPFDPSEVLDGMDSAEFEDEDDDLPDDEQFDLDAEDYAEDDEDEPGRS